MFQPQIRRDNNVRVNHRIRSIVHFGVQSSLMISYLKMHIGGLMEKSMYKLSLVSNAKRMYTIKRPFNRELRKRELIICLN